MLLASHRSKPMSRQELGPFSNICFLALFCFWSLYSSFFFFFFFIFFFLPRWFLYLFFKIFYTLFYLSARVPSFSRDVFRAMQDHLSTVIDQDGLVSGVSLVGGGADVYFLPLSSFVFASEWMRPPSQFRKSNGVRSDSIILRGSPSRVFSLHAGPFFEV